MGVEDAGARKPYRSDLSDERWALIEPVITAWKARHPSVSGHSGRYPMREIVNAILYQERTGCGWEYLPHDLPPRSAVYYYFARWRDDGLTQTIHDLLRGRVREVAGRAEDPSAVVMDSQTVHAAAGVPSATTGLDAGKKSRGRKRGIATDANKQPSEIYRLVHGSLRQMRLHYVDSAHRRTRVVCAVKAGEHAKSPRSAWWDQGLVGCRGSS